MKTRISLIAAMSSDGVIGKDGKIPWHLPEELKFFRKKTLGYPVIMGRKTYESIGKPLKGRTNIVMSHQDLDLPEECLLAKSKEEAIELAGYEMMVIGGETIYSEFLHLADELILSTVAGEYEGDAHFPLIGEGHWTPVANYKGRGFTATTYTRNR